MAQSRSPAERRDDLAGDREDAAEHRDTTAGDRDDAAGHRDATAAERDEDTRRELATFTGRLLTIHQQIISRLTPDENTADPATVPNLTRAQIHHREGLAALDHAAITRLIDDLGRALHHLQSDVVEAAADRRAAARDRHHSARDREGSARDRASGAHDRDQTAIERAQDGFPPLTQVQNLPPRPEHPVSRTPHALSESRRRLTASREQLDRSRAAGPGEVRGPGS